MPEQTYKALELVLKERQRQLAKWGNQSGIPPEKWPIILGEEFGELCEAFYETHTITAHTKPERGGLDNIITEATHVAAVAVAIIEAMMTKAKQEGGAA